MECLASLDSQPVQTWHAVARRLLRFLRRAGVLTADSDGLKEVGGGTAAGAWSPCRCMRRFARRIFSAVEAKVVERETNYLGLIMAALKHMSRRHAAWRLGCW